VNQKTKVYNVQFTHSEAWVLLRALATANDAGDRDQNAQDRSTRTWLADRLLGLVGNEVEEERTL
jgi:hypothetical protein